MNQRVTRKHTCKDGKVIRALPAKESAVPVRRGTGPKARLQAFLDAYDAYMALNLSKYGDDMSFEELQECDRLETAMIAARMQITTKLGLGD